jgi:galactokinase
VENIHVGAQSGLLDPLASLFGEPDHALLLDFRSLRVSPVPLPDCALVVCDTLVRHSHASGEYNLRRSECEQGLRELQTLGLGIQSLRDIDMPELQAARPNLQDVSWRRCHHVVSENLRVTSMQHALLEGNLVFAGELMRASHASLRDDFQVSCAELDLLVELAGGIPGVFGARMTGGGFGGCTINLVSTDALPGFRRRIIERYLASTGKTPQLHECSAVRGAGRLS